MRSSESPERRSLSATAADLPGKKKTLRQEAELSAKRQIDEAANKVRDIVAEYDRLVREKDQFLKKLRVSMESELAILNHAINGFPNTDMEEKPEEMEQPKKQEVPSEDTVPMEKTSEPETDGEKKEE